MVFLAKVFCGMIATREHDLRASEMPNAAYLLGPLAGRRGYLPSRNDVLLQKQSAHPAMGYACFTRGLVRNLRHHVRVRPSLHGTLITSKFPGIWRCHFWPTISEHWPIVWTGRQLLWRNPLVRQLERQVCREGYVKLSAFLRPKTENSVGRPRLLCKKAAKSRQLCGSLHCRMWPVTYHHL
jgi:hypothetical protein